MMFLYHVAIVVFSVLGVVFHGYFFSVHLFHIVIGNHLLIQVIRAVTSKGTALLWLAALMVVIIYIYSLISFAFLRKAFDPEEGAFCQTAFQVDGSFRRDFHVASV